MSFVKNAWYVAGWASEFDHQLSTVRILGDDLVMYRTSKGEVVALQDCCPHKLLPLSMGRIIKDQVECGYHGLKFDPDGRCTHAPSQPRVPPSVCVRAYPVHERHDIVWVWMGDPEKADVDAVFDLPQLGDRSWENHQGEALYMKSNYMNVAENLLDPAHIRWVHQTYWGTPEHAEVPVETDITGNPICVGRWVRNAPPIPYFQKYADFNGNVDRWQYFYLYLPSTSYIDFGSADAALALPEDRRHEGVQLFSFHFLTPVSATETIDRWMHIRNTHIGDDSVTETVNGMFRSTFLEDKPVLEAIQRQEGKPQAISTVELAIDRGPLAYRARIKELVALEMEQDTTDGDSIPVRLPEQTQRSQAQVSRHN